MLILGLAVGTASAQLGSGVVYDPTNYHNALLRYYQLQQHLLQLQKSYAKITSQLNLAMQMASYVRNMPARYRAVFSQWRNVTSLNTFGNTGSWITAQGTYYDSSGLGWNYDDVLFTNGQPAFDNNGPLFSFQTSAGTDILGNLYSVGSQFYLSVDNPTGLWNPGDPGTLQVSVIPIPAALPLFATALGAVGLAFLAP